MPEGPEIRRVADQLAQAVVGRPLGRVWFAKPDLQCFAEPLSESIVTDVKTRGKALLTSFDCGLTVYSHNQLYGRWYFRRAGERPKTGRQLRWLLETDQRAALLYSASEIEVLDEQGLAEHRFLARAGLDILSDKPTLTQLKKYLSQQRFSRRALGALLLDQGFIAGTGNYLRSEILFVAGLPPDQQIGRLDAGRLSALARAIRDITQRAYRTGGITVDDGLASRLKNRGWSRRQYRHFVFARAGELCHRCLDMVEKKQVAGRRLYLCPICQPRFTDS